MGVSHSTRHAPAAETPARHLRGRARRHRDPLQCNSHVRTGVQEVRTPSQSKLPHLAGWLQAPGRRRATASPCGTAARSGLRGPVRRQVRPASFTYRKSARRTSSVATLPRLDKKASYGESGAVNGVNALRKKHIRTHRLVDENQHAALGVCSPVEHGMDLRHSLCNGARSTRAMDDALMHREHTFAPSGAISPPDSTA